ncbi:MAG: hypothetical protein JWM98_1623, partial [Thermoleophilia bacterium]|nr:hypothetical protein [Thermoleophilia bacterium]
MRGSRRIAGFDAGLVVAAIAIVLASVGLLATAIV